MTEKCWIPFPNNPAGMPPSECGARCAGVMVAPNLMRLDTFAGLLPLGPGDVLEVHPARAPRFPNVVVATGVHSTLPRWIIEMSAHLPEPRIIHSDIDWGAAQLSAADALAQVAHRFDTMQVTTKFSALLSTVSWQPFADFLTEARGISHYEVYRSPSSSITWTGLLAGAWDERPVFDRNEVAV